VKNQFVHYWRIWERNEIGVKVDSNMDECNANGTILNKTGCILSYAGNSTDILINYFVFLINIAVAVIVVLRQRKQLRSRNKHDVANALGVFSVCSLIGGKKRRMTCSQYSYVYNRLNASSL